MSLVEQKQKVQRIRKYFLAKKETIAVAESVTSGLLQIFFSNIPDAGQFYQGGLTAYNLGQKFKHLNVEPIHAQKHNCVSPLVAEQMALQVCTVFNSDWGLGITGYATPVPESGHRLYAHFAIVYKGAIRATGKLHSKKISPLKVQQLYADEITDHLTELLDKSK